MCLLLLVACCQKERKEENEEEIRKRKNIRKLKKALRQVRWQEGKIAQDVSQIMIIG